MPRKVFVAGEILTAADVNANLMDQAVMVFDDAAARTTAIPSPVEGMVTYLKSDKSVTKFNGTAFVPIGTILQVVSAVKTDTFSASVGAGASTALTGLTASITPSSTSSKLLIEFAISGQSDVTDRSMGFVITANGSAVSSLGDSAGSRVRATFITSNQANTSNSQTTSGTFLYSPGSTSAQTIGVNLVMINTVTANVFVNRSVTDSDNQSTARTISTLTVMEVAS